MWNQIDRIPIEDPIQIPSADTRDVTNHYPNKTFSISIIVQSSNYPGGAPIWEPDYTSINIPIEDPCAVPKTAPKAVCSGYSNR